MSFLRLERNSADWSHTFHELQVDSCFCFEVGVVSTKDILMECIMNNEREKFVALFGVLGPLSAKDALKCIELARLAMLNGECSVEAYYAAKNILLSEVETPSLLIN